MRRGDTKKIFRGEVWEGIWVFESFFELKIFWKRGFGKARIGSFFLKSCSGERLKERKLKKKKD